jgi:nicotinate-nucleotide adenylyltransferase
MPEAGEIRRVGVMGGTFDPIHLGHLIAGSEAMHAFELDRVMFVPTGQPWQKSEYSDPEDRYMMALLGAESHVCFAVSRIELDRRGPTYTADTMQQLNDFYGSDVELFFIAGADAILQLQTWEHVDRLKGLTQMIAVSRPGFDLAKIETHADWPVVHAMEMPGIDISATSIRDRVRSGRPIDFLVPHPVHDFIRKQGLYAS